MFSPLTKKYSMYPFLFVVSAWQDWSEPDEQFEAFTHVLKQYLLPVSPDEINIESKMRKRLAALRTR